MNGSDSRRTATGPPGPKSGDRRSSVVAKNDEHFSKETSRYDGSFERNFNRMRTSFIIEVVTFNIDEVEALGGDPARIQEEVPSA